MNIKDQYHTIANMVSKELLGSINDAERKQLESWVSASEENRRIYARLKEDGWYRSHQMVYVRFDAQQGWEQVAPRLKGSGKVISLRTKLVRYAAVAASLLLFLTGYLYREQIDGYFDQGPVAPIITNNNIVPGSPKATLTLSNGDQVALGEKDSVQVGNARSNGSEIVYQEAYETAGMEEMNTLTVPRGGEFVLALSDGSKVWLNSDSQVRYPVHFVKGQSRNIELVYGEIYLDVTSSELHEGSRFAVVHSGQTVEVLGTEFNIKAYPEEPEVVTTLVEGKVQIAVQEGSRVLLPGQQSLWSRTSGAIKIREADVFREVAWKDGIFSFKDKPLVDIMRVFSRWYDMDVQFGSEDIKELTFNGTLHKDQSIEDILHFLEGTIHTYEINDATIILK